MPALTGGVTYSDVIVEALCRYPDRDAFVDGDRRISYAETADLTSRMMQVLSARGVRRGSAVAALSPNVPEVWMVQAAAYLLGATFSGLHPLGSIDDYVIVCEDAQAEVLVVHPEFAEAAAAVVERAPTVRHVLTLGASEVGQDLQQLCSNVQARPLERGPATEGDTSWLQYAGDTEGRPKGVMIPHRAMVQQVQSMATAAGLPEAPRYLASSPISHAAVVPIVPTLSRGGTVVLHRSFDPERWLHTVQQERINYAFAVPTMLYMLLDNGTPERFDLSSLETIIYGASPMSPSRIAEAQNVLGHVLLQVYGQTEYVSFATTLRKDEHDPVKRPELLASCGRPVVGARVELLDDDDQIVPVGQIGEICVRGRGAMTGYKNLPERSQSALRSGWIHTGDMAKRDEAGFFYILDRKKDMIITGGFNVYPREIEDVITTFPSVASVAVIGIPDEKWGELVMAMVVPQPGTEIDPEELALYVRNRKGRHQAPKRIEFVDALPTTAAGAVDKAAIRERYWATLTRQVH